MYLSLTFQVFAGCLLNYPEGVRTQATLRIPFAWMPVYNNKMAPNCLGRDYESHTPCQLCLEHDALSVIFNNWDLQTGDAVQLYWGGKTCLQD